MAKRKSNSSPIRPIKKILRARRLSPSLRARQNTDTSYELQLLEELVHIDSATLNVAGVTRMQKRVAQELESFGFTSRLVPSVDPRFAPLLVAEIEGESPQFVSFVTHTDTVLKNFSPTPFAVSPDGATVQGSGVIDNKGGLVVGLSSLRHYLKSNKPHYSLRFVCSPNEEMGSIGFIDDFRKLSEDTVLALGLEPALENGDIINQRRGNRWYNISIQGKEAHAGRSYGTHINAAHELALKIAKLQKLTNYRDHVSVNFNHIEAGRDRHNVICGRADVKLDTRFSTFASRDKLHDAIVDCLNTSYTKSTCKRYTATSSYEVVDDCPPFSPSMRSRWIVRQYLKTLKKREARSVRARGSGGAGDVNYFSRRGVLVLDGLGPVGAGMHTEDEIVEVPTLLTRSRALSDFLSYFNKSVLI